VAQPVFSFVPSTQSVTGVKSEMIEEPLLGGTLSATSEQAAEDAKRGLDDQQNKTILEHSYLEGSGQAEENAINSIGQTEETRNIDIFSDAPMSTLPPKVNVVDLPMPPPLPDFSTLPPSSDLLDLSVPYSEPAVSSTLQPASDISATKNDPTQFQIPGQ